MKKLKILAKSIMSCLIAVAMFGCVGRFTGGGSIDSAAGAPGKATFGFVIDAIEPDEFGNPTAIKGQFQYNDNAAGVQFHVDQMEPAFYARIFPNLFDPQAVMFAYSGTYSSPAGSGWVDLGVSSHMQVDPFGIEHNQDAVFVQVTSGPYAGYGNVGLVRNGTIHFKSAK